MTRKADLANSVLNMIGWICNETTSTGLYKVRADRVTWPFVDSITISTTEKAGYIYFQLKEIKIDVNIWTRTMFGFALRACLGKIKPEHYFILDQIADNLDILRTYNLGQVIHQPRHQPKLLCRQIT